MNSLSKIERRVSLVSANLAVLLAACSPETSEPVLEVAPSPIFLGCTEDALAALRSEFRASDPPEEIIVLFSQGGWDNDGQRVIRVRRGVPKLAYYESEPAPFERVLTQTEWSDVQLLMADPDLVEPKLCATYCVIEYIYVHLTADDETRFFLGSPNCYTEWASQEVSERDSLAGALTESDVNASRPAFELLFSLRGLVSRDLSKVDDKVGLYLVEDD